MQQYDIKVAANGTFPLAAAGRYIKYLSGNNGGGDVSLVVSPVGQPASKIVLVPGQAFRVSDAGPTPSGWVLSNNAGGATISGYVVVGDGRIDDPTINGTVQVVDGGKARTLGNAAFIGKGYQAAVAAQQSRVQLWMPAGSNMRAVVECFLAGSATAEGPNIYRNTAAAANLVTAGQSKLLGGAAGAAQVRVDSTAAPDGTLIGGLFLQASAGSVYTFREPIVLLPGNGLVIVGNSNADLLVMFEWYEEPNV